MWTAEQTRALVEKLRRENDEFAAWAAGVRNGDVRLEGAEREAYGLGYRAGRARLDAAARSDLTGAMTPRERVAWSYGYGEGRNMPAVDPYAPTPRTIADLIGEARARAAAAR